MPQNAAAKIRVATDVGGTFTDLVSFEIDDDSGQATVRSAKSPTTSPDFDRGVLDVFDRAGIVFEDVQSHVHGTTVVINAITERKGAKVGLIATEGFRDTLAIARGNRPDFFNLDYEKPEPFVPRYLSREVAGRLTYTGEEREPIDLTGLAPIVEDFRADGVEAIAVCLMHSWANPIHEQAVFNELERLWPEVAVVISSDITREWREYERTSTTVLSAYVQPVAAKYLRQLESQLEAKSLGGPTLVMQSNCGVGSVESVAAAPIVMVESGPASGFFGAAELGRQIGEDNLLALDIGGTTAKCSLIENGQVRVMTDYWLERTRSSAGYPALVPVVDLIEIGNGGGSIAWVDEFDKLHVGPQSAGSKPGPVSYGAGGTKVTTTDANLWLGRISQDDFCGGDITPDMEATEAALSKVGAALGLSVDDAARGIVRIANNNMVNALKLISLNRGHDPRHFTMVAFGGGGPMHAVALANELGVAKVVVPNSASVFSAWGMIVSDIRRDYFVTALADINEASIPSIVWSFAQTEERAREEFRREDADLDQLHITRYARLRYAGQEHTTEIEVNDGDLSPAGLPDLIERFGQVYEAEYTYRLGTGVEMVGLHLVATIPNAGEPPSAVALGDVDASSARQEHGRSTTPMTAPASRPSTTQRTRSRMQFVGPAVVEGAGTSVLVHPGWTGAVDGLRNLILERNTPRHTGSEVNMSAYTHDPITLEIIQNSFQAAADEMFVAMRKTAVSSIIYEVLDMGTAILDEHGELASSGAGIPAFVGVLDKACKVIIDTIGRDNIEPGDVFITNDPYHGGVTHLNDVVVAKPVFHGEELIAWTANIAHNSDIGGMAPGSASGDATEIYQEGIRLPPIKAISRGETVRSVFDIIMTNSRLPDSIEGDLWAAIASVRTGDRSLVEVAERYGVDAFRAASQDFMAYGERVARKGLSELPNGTFSLTEEIDDGRILSVDITISDDAFVVDLRNNPDQATAPTNCSRDAAMIPVQMIFKSLTDAGLTANSGSFRPIELLTRPGSVFEPLEPAPMGFYYDLLLPLYDLLWRCLAPAVPDKLGAGHFASVCATFIGGTHPDSGRPYAIIEPQIGGWGAGQSRDGNAAMFSGVHGETYNCPAEVNEVKNGLFVKRLALNTEPGGEGRFTGGRGIVTEYEVRADDGYATLAFTRSKFPPWSLGGGRPGSPNYCEIITAADGESTRYSFASAVPTSPGDVIRIVTGNGGGVGDPTERDRELVARDVRDGFLSADEAAEIYGS